MEPKVEGQEENLQNTQNENLENNQEKTFNEEEHVKNFFEQKKQEALGIKTEEKKEEPVVQPENKEGAQEETNQEDTRPLHEQLGYTTVEELKAALEQKKETPTYSFKNQLAEQLEKFSTTTEKTSPEEFRFYTQTEIKDEMTTEDMVSLIVSKQILENPELAPMKEALTKRVKKEYMLDMKEAGEDVASEDEKLDAALKEKQLKKDANDIIEDIKTVRQKMESGGKTPEQIEQEKQEYTSRENEWKSHSDEIKKELKLDIEDFEVKEDKMNILKTSMKTFNFDPVVADQYSSFLYGIAKDMGFPKRDTPEYNKAHEMAMMSVFWFNRHSLIKESINHGRALEKGEEIKSNDNPSADKRPDQIFEQKKIISEQEAVNNYMKKGQ